jgi:hypothetical protein
VKIVFLAVLVNSAHTLRNRICVPQALWMAGRLLHFVLPGDFAVPDGDFLPQQDRLGHEYHGLAREWVNLMCCLT